ncbi:sensor domain-containing diguanylate cyclase [Psychrobacillus soli]|uniref:Diguanylate cyclase n=1 Tax=Psychrobacillus soli TaxID=1543965 RepID=A0A544TDD5_9BACI|nr:diguanylate cyclase [Psychrobacillus soli]TQR15455.1 diguanylate cyclase [Psychrobacillus soli]
MTHINQQVLDSLLDQIAVINQDGLIIAVNKSWINFSHENDGDLSTSGIGSNYLHVCKKKVRKGIECVLTGRKSHFIFEYSCHSKTEIRWFLLRATPFINNADDDSFVIVSHVDITNQKLIEFNLQRSENYYRLIAESSTDFISTQTLDGVYTYISHMCNLTLGYDSSEMLGKSAEAFIHPEDVNLFTSLQDLIQNEDKIQTITYRIRCKNGKYIWFETKCQVFLASNGECEEILCISRDVTTEKLKLNQLERETHRLQKAIFIDELTGVHNRRFFNKILNEEYKKSIHSKNDFSLLMIDIDYFKQYNDTYGHPKGDQCLSLVANTLKSHVSDIGFVCRIGGEEFCIILPNINNDQAISLANKLRYEVEELKVPHANSQTSLYITISIGVATTISHHSPQIDSSELLVLADQALYKAKEDGRNHVINNVVFDNFRRSSS